MTVLVKMEAPFEFCADCPYKDIYVDQFYRNEVYSMGRPYCENQSHCTYVARKIMEKQEDDGK